MGDGDFVQLLTPDGERTERAVGHDGVEYTVDLTDDEYRGLYRDMVVTRRLDAEGVALQRQGEMALWASLYGQEAAQIGSGRALRPQDMVFPSYREHGVLTARGLDPLLPFGLFRGVDQGAWDPEAYKTHMYTLVVGAQTLHATGYAMGVTLDGRIGDDGEAVIVYFGDGATAQGDVNESFIWAGVHQAPIVFFCQNNQYAISVGTERQSRAPIHRRSAGFGFPGLRVDGNDVLASYAVTRHAMDRARRGGGPTLIEAYTYRMGAHTTSDDPTRYRLAAEQEAWAARDPIARLATFLRRQQLADEDFFVKIEEEVQHLAVGLRERVVNLPNPGRSAIFDHAYAHGSPLVEQQRARFEAYATSFES
ncbi:pyruvate dehydrogenase (acetyl-transferring) E1 component subunit alpha [Catenuloplanes atrovinosus]|uniref:Pyruvate dehydrogenase E1 component alpha subunit n=1 Tax=Catenuloplanes atrovinosus TaxID=137266 RepID=A0AAE3YKI5_9ACTN|nr:pyruvate dehydrogenase (acetyl-transferring) E1 component subunit alpha [Catenuloplanes atrovinosus]MDR7273858.1 pyruvate dehydrogenase E1 component alpha subunit [Catenuloplanes atrovinosus]